MASGIELAPLLTKIKLDIKSFSSDMEKVKTEAVSKTNEVSKQMEKTIKVGESMSKVGSTLTKTLTVPIAGAGIAATKMAIDYETSFAKVSTLLDSNKVDFDKYKNDILDASSESKVAVGEFSEAVYQSISAGVDQTKAVKFTTDAMKLAKGGFTDGAKAVDVMTTAINGYSLKTSDATKISDMLITTQNLGKTTVDQLAESMGKVIPIANSVNFGMDELSASYAQLTKNGIATAEAGTYLKAMLQELGKSGSITDKTLRELTGKGFAELKTEGKSTSEILNMLNDYAIANNLSLKDMFGSVEAGTAALVMSKGEGKEYDEMLKAMGDSAGATQEAFEKMDATPAEQLKGALNELKNSAIKLGANMIPIVTKITDGINGLVDWFNELTPAQQDNIVKMGLMVAAAGPLLKIVGSLVSGYGKLKPLLSGTNVLFQKGVPLLGKLGSSLVEHTGIVGKLGGMLTKLTAGGSSAASSLTTVASGAAGLGTATAGATAASGGLLASLGGMAAAALPWVAGATAIVGAGKLIYDGLQKEVIPEVELFGDIVEVEYNKAGEAIGLTTTKISESTQKQVQSYLDLSNSAQQISLEMYTGVTAITDENVTKLTGKVDEMANKIITANEDQKDKVISSYQTMFENTTAINAQEQVQILNDVNTAFEARKISTENLRDELAMIYQQISDNGGSITQSQQERIDEIYNQMKENAVQTMAQNEAEQNVILNRLSSSTERITAEMVGNTIKEINKEYKEQVKTAGKKRDELVRTAEELKTLEGGKYRDKAEQIIEAANEEYEKTVEASEKIKTEGIDKLMTAHSEFADDVDIKTGKVVSYWDKMFGTWDRWTPPKKTAEIETVYKTSRVNGRNVDMYMATGKSYIPYDGYNARLHEGERVLTKEENKEYSSRLRGDKKITINIPFNIDGREFAIAQKEFTLEELGFGV